MPTKANEGPHTYYTHPSETTVAPRTKTQWVMRAQKNWMKERLVEVRTTFLSSNEVVPVVVVVLWL